MRSKTSIASGAKESDHGFGIKDGNGENAWSMVTKEAEALINLDKNVSSFSSASKADKSCEGFYSCSMIEQILMHYNSILSVCICFSSDHVLLVVSRKGKG